MITKEDCTVQHRAGNKGITIHIGEARTRLFKKAIPTGDKEKRIHWFMSKVNVPDSVEVDGIGVTTWLIGTDEFKQWMGG